MGGPPRRGALPGRCPRRGGEDWLAYGLERGWFPLCKDGRIRGRQAERAPLEQHGAVLFHLDNQRLLVSAVVERFARSQEAIFRAVERGGPAAFAVREHALRRTWP
ncbi:hypothetical protein [Actinokineospora globicatena]|uniref:PIN-like domain-containing protein n=1 Tax=Actinokineospora globicatena TaxID=103729 RepID=UPI003D7FA444